MNILKQSCVVLSAVLLAIGCVDVSGNQSNLPALCGTTRGTHVKPERAADAESPSVNAAKQTLRRFMATRHWRDRKPDSEITNAVNILGRAGEAGIDLLKTLSTSNDAFLPYDAMRAIVRSGSKRGPFIVSRFMHETRPAPMRILVIWAIRDSTNLSRDLKSAYSQIVVSEIWRSREPNDLAGQGYLVDLVTTLEILDGKTYWKGDRSESLFCSGLTSKAYKELQRAVRRCLVAHLSMT